MTSGGIQISIPDFDEDDYGSTPIFGRVPGGGLWGASNSGQDSPTVATPLVLSERAEKSYFHSRGDSAASEDSVHSIQTTRKIKSPFAHSAQSSVATSSTSPFTKKSSFASLRNAFKSTKSNDSAPPPLPPLDHQAYPALRNPFNRSTSSLAHHPPMPQRRPSVQASPPHFRPSTPASGDYRTRNTPSKSKTHSYARSQHSHSGSIFHSSDTGSDHGHGYSYTASSSPPPVPPMPHMFGRLGHRDDMQSLSDLEDKINMDPRTPSDYALHAIFIRFAASAESHVEDFLQQPLDRDPQLVDFMGPGVDPKLDELLLSLGKIAEKHAKPVVDSVMRWRKCQNDPVSGELYRIHASQSSATVRALRSQDVQAILNERKSLAAIYIMCRALVAATQSISKDALGEAVGHSLEELTFEQFKRPDAKILTQSANHRANAELYATLLGNLANVRFESVTDRFLVELGPVAAGQVPKDADFKYENLVRALKHVPIKVWPPESFEEGAEFMASLSKSFENAHGNRLKTTFAETLVQLLHPIGKTAQAEVNHPEWAKAIEVIYPKAKDMMSKPRYWHVAYPLAITALCVAPREYFLRNMQACMEAGIGKLKEKIHRIPVLNGMMRLIWTYLYRCHEPASTTTSKLEAVTKLFFPPNRLTIAPQEDHLQPFIYIVHYILSRHFDFGSELCLDLLQERNITAQPTNLSVFLAPERMAVATQAILLSTHLIEREEPIPTWPSTSDFNAIASWEDYPSSSAPVPQQVLSKAGWKDFLDRASSCLNAIANHCFQTAGKWSILDDQWSLSRLSPAYEEAHNYVVRHHAEGSIAYPNQSAPQIVVLQLIYQSWPRCLHPSLVMDDVFDMLIQGVIHVEPAVGEAATQALQRMIVDPAHTSHLLARFSAFLFDPDCITNEGSGLRLTVDCVRLVNLWVSFVDRWTHSVTQKPRQDMADDETVSVIARIDEVEAGALFLLTHHHRSICSAGVKALRMLNVVILHLEFDVALSSTETPERLIDAFYGRLSISPFLHGNEDILEPEEFARLEQWRSMARPDVALRLADSDNAVDRSLWGHIYPSFLQSAMEHTPTAFLPLREKITAAAGRYHSFLLQLSGVQSKSAPNLPQRSGSNGDKDGPRLVNENKHAIRQWHMWMKIICATAQVSDARPAQKPQLRDHSRGQSEVDGEYRMTTTRDLFKYLSQFLDSDYSVFRDTAVSCISSFPARGYSHLLEDLSILASRQFYDEGRSKSITAPMVGRARRQERFHTAVARIYYLTAHLLRDQRSSGKQISLTHVLKYIRNVQTFLSSPEHRDLFSLQRLRRYFCGTVERLFDGLATLKDSDRFIPPNIHLALYNLCEEWCQLGKQSESVKRRLVEMQTAAARAYSDPTDQAELIQRFQTETRALSNAAVGAMAALCHKAFYPPEISSGSPTDRLVGDHLKPLQASATLDRLTAILAAFHEPVQNCGKKALRSLLSHTPCDQNIVQESLRRAFVTTREMDTSNARFFDVVADVICNVPTHSFTFSQVICLGLSNLCHPLLEIRRLAFNILDILHEQSSGLISLVQYEAAVCSSAPSAYLHAHRLISDVLAGEHPVEAVDVLAQFAGWLPRVYDGREDKGTLLMLQSLEYWVPNIDLMADDKSGLSREGRTAIYHLMALTIRYAESHAEQVLVLWTRLVDAPYQTNGHATIRFLLEQSPKVGSALFISCAAKVVACLSQSVVGRQLMHELCGVIEPARILPTMDHKISRPDTEDMELWSDLDILFSGQPRLPLGMAQFALLFLSEAALDRYWELQEQMPILLHALCMHFDHRQPFVRQRSRHMLFQLLRSCVSGYDELPDRAAHRTRHELRSVITLLQQQAETRLWKDEDGSTQAETAMKWFCGEILDLLTPLHPDLADRWATVALSWGTACSIRHIAFRSLQLHRALQTRITLSDLGMIIGRLSNTIGEDDQSIQEFNVELILTLRSLASSNLHVTLLPQMFWCAVACLLTTVQEEFQHALQLLDVILTKFDLGETEMVDLLMTHKPINWNGDQTFQSCLLIGLRSSATSDLTFKLLQRLSKIDDGRLIDPTEARVRDLYTLSLPWCLQAMHTETQEESLQEFALNIARLAEQEERPSIDKIMTSFAKGRFRTKDDFLRQSVASLREHYGADHWTEVVTLLMGLVLNKERWLRVHTMMILKVLFQQRETRSPVDLLGSELLMPLLRLLETDLVPQALDVLDEPMQISGGPSAKHVLRMSLFHHLRADAKEVESVAEIFGIPQESGWCVPRSGALREVCRANVGAVFDLCKVTTRPSRIDFHTEAIVGLADIGTDEDDLQEMVQNLHELSNFFQQGLPASKVPHRQLEARVAAILAKSTDLTSDVPQTPLVDVFDVRSVSPYQDSEYSESDTESDLFEFDSPSIARSIVNTLRHH
ncbi:hypothetical protein OBBRIDRAFT_885610 [Obba rivulosa]|uniref:Uncharacterized protein n=1 Tax=Obba rivulosa TaxID=1052685 RepID=A0A8E2DPG4_9APHY|nr:hypothetical protein OBBRIDRAFT_885610 [Obba rivulosa]